METIKENQTELADVDKLIKHENLSVAATEEVNDRNELAKNLRSVWESLSMDEKHRVLRVFIDRIILYRDKIEVHYNF